MDKQKAAMQYQQMDLQTKIGAADPHQLISMLMRGVIERANQAKCYIEQSNVQSKNDAINKAIDIINGLRASLNMDAAEETSEQLESLYHFMIGHLVEANRENSLKKLDEIVDLMTTVLSGWEQIPQDIRQQFSNQQTEQTT